VAGERGGGGVKRRGTRKRSIESMLKGMEIFEGSQLQVLGRRKRKKV